MRILNSKTGSILNIELNAVCERVKSAIGGDSNSSFARKTGLSEGVIRGYLAGKNLPGAAALIAISNATGVTIEWLLTGREPKLRADLKRLHAVATAAADEYAYIPKLDVRAAAGAGQYVDQHEEEVGKIAFRRDWLRRKGLLDKDLAAIQVRGDSMLPTIHDGALALVDTRPISQISDGVYALYLNETLMVKRLQRDFDGSLYIRSDNPYYREYHLTEEQASQLNIAGRIFWAGGEI